MKKVGSIWDLKMKKARITPGPLSFRLKKRLETVSHRNARH